MASDDVWFLLVFIILPTAVLVSGFWAFFFVRRDPRTTIPRQQRHATEPKSTRTPAQETVQVATVPPPRVSDPALGDEDQAFPDTEPERPVAGPALSELEDGEPEREPDADPGLAASSDDDDLAAPAELESLHAESNDEDLLPGVVETVSEPDPEPADDSVDAEHPALPEDSVHDDTPASEANAEETLVIQSTTDELPQLDAAAIEPARLSAPDDHDEWKPQPDAELAEGATLEDDAPVDPDDGGGSEGHKHQGHGARAYPSDTSDDENLSAADEDENDESSGESPRRFSASQGDATEQRPRRGRRRPGTRLIPSESNDRKPRRWRLGGRSSRRSESGPDEGGM